MPVIWKYPLEVMGEQDIEMPSGRILSVQNQGGQLVLWAAVDPDAEPHKVKIVIKGTGHPFEWDHEEGTLSYFTSVQQGEFVWHVFIVNELPW